MKLGVDIIFASGSEATRAAKRTTTSIPIVMTSTNPVGLGFVASLARPGGNITGVSLMGPEASGKRLQLIKEIVPGIVNIALLWNPDDPGAADSLKETVAAAKRLALKPQILVASDQSALRDAFESAVNESAQAVLPLPAPLMSQHARLIAEIAVQKRLPTMYISADLPKAGGLVSYGVDIGSLNRRAAYYVDRIFKGAKPADLPVEQPTKFDLVINLKTAKALSLTIPPGVLALADSVIE